MLKIGRIYIYYYYDKNLKKIDKSKFSVFLVLRKIKSGFILKKMISTQEYFREHSSFNSLRTNSAEIL